MSVEEDKFAYRLEKRAGIGISFTFVAIAFIVGGQASAHLAESHHPNNDTAMIVLAALSVVAFAVLGGVKWHISDKLKSPTMKKDAICSLAVGVISLAVTVSASAYSANDAVWWFDALVAVLVSGFLLIYGCRTLFCHGHRWWESSFWKNDAESMAAHEPRNGLDLSMQMDFDAACIESETME